MVDLSCVLFMLRREAGILTCHFRPTPFQQNRAHKKQSSAHAGLAMFEVTEYICLLKYNFNELVLHLSISILCYIIFLLHYNSQRKIILFYVLTATFTSYFHDLAFKDAG